MVETPGATAVTTPEPEPIVATAGVLLAQTPPRGRLVRVTTSPTQSLEGPEIFDGSGFTVTFWVTNPREPRLYVIVVTPALTPNTIPEDEPIVPIATLLLLQTPPGAVFESVVVDPTHTVKVPVIGGWAMDTMVKKQRITERRNLFIVQFLG